MSPRDTDLREYERIDQGAQHGGETEIARPVQQDLSGRGEGDGSARWHRFVVPYQYYGPGYRGVGYYSVFYLGSEESNAGQGESAFDQPGIKYGQGQGAGAAWTSGRHGSSRGGQAGRGPKGYQRSDERIREEISDRLMADDDLDASDIEVAVKGGEVTLTGMVEDRSAKRLAELIAESVMGVEDVMNGLRVGPGSQGSQRSDTMSPRSDSSGQPKAAETPTPTSSQHKTNGGRVANQSR